MTNLNENKVESLLKKAGYKFSKKNWPTIKKETLSILNITPKMLNSEYQQATINQTMGPQWCYGLYLDCGHMKKALARRAK